MSVSTSGWVVFLTATELEASPLLDGLRIREPSEVAGKKMYLGELDVATDRFAHATSDATARDARESIPVALMVTGCDKVNAAHGLTCVLQTVCADPALVVQTGIGGAFARTRAESRDGELAPGPAVGDVVVATQEAYSDTGTSSPEGWLSPAEIDLPVACGSGVETFGVFPLDKELVETARSAIVERMGGEEGLLVHAGPCVTASLITGTDEEAQRLIERWGALAESMEGAAAAHVCLLHGIPFLEIRGMSNLVGHRDRGSWQVEKAVSVAGRAALAAVEGLWEQSRGERPGAGGGER